MEPEDAMKMYKHLFDKTKRDEFDEKTRKLVYWMIYRLLRVITGNRWKPTDTLNSNEEKSEIFVHVFQLLI
jgi:hypothetical protein